MGRADQGGFDFAFWYLTSVVAFRGLRHVVGKSKGDDP